MSARLSVNINDETAAALREMQARHGTTMTEEVRRAVSVYAYFKARQDEGYDVEVVTERAMREDKVERVRIL